MYVAARHTAAVNRQRIVRASGQTYIHGNTAPKPDYTPGRRVTEPPRKKRVSRQVRKNRKNALRMSRGYVVFLSVAAVLTLVICVNYIQMQSRLTLHSKNITALQKELAERKEENTTKYNAVMDSVNLEEVRERAQNDLKMKYAAPEQIVGYKKPSTDYVKQYEDIPESGVLAQSDKQ